MTEFTHIDIDHLEKYIMGDAALRDEILSIFAEQVEMLMGQFDAAHPDKSWKDTAHAMKGASRGVGAWKLGDLCEEAETLIGDIAAKREKRSSLLISIRKQLVDCMADATRLREAA